MKPIIIFLFLIAGSLCVSAQKKDIKYFYYSLNNDMDFMDYLKAKKEFNNRKFEFELPKSNAAIKELEQNEKSILKNDKTYTAFLTKYNMPNAGEYAELWYNQMTTLKSFIRKNPDFYALSPKERQNIIDKWYYSQPEKE